MHPTIDPATHFHFVPVSVSIIGWKARDLLTVNKNTHLSLKEFVTPMGAIHAAWENACFG